MTNKIDQSTRRGQNALDEMAKKRLEKGKATNKLAKTSAASGKIDPAEFDSTRPVAKTRQFASIEPQEIQWLWPTRIALGKLTLFAGDPGLGKSMLSASLAAYVTTLREWPDGAECEHPGDVVLISAEDDPADTLRPRLDAAGADVSRVHLLEYIEEETKEKIKRRSFSIADVEALDGLMSKIKAKLIVIDPISAYLDGTDSHKNADVRALLTPLADLAASRGVAIVGITHLNKGGGSAMYRSMGSLAFVAAARAAYMVAKDPDEPERRLILPVKNNLGDDRTGLAYEIVTGENGAPMVRFEEGIIETTADEALMPDENRSELEDAEEFLLETLKHGERQSTEIIKEAKQAGIAEKTLRRAKTKLRIKSAKQEISKKWVWRLSESSEKVAKVAKVAKISNEAIGHLPDDDWGEI
ncbi:MAG: AAA family ATPase [Methylothermaceae bacterium]|nr:AAA family ATPase [Methylothermaceae bacterium]